MTCRILSLKPPSSNDINSPRIPAPSRSNPPLKLPKTLRRVVEYSPLPRISHQRHISIFAMAGKKTENTRKVAGNARKADVAAQKAAVEDTKQAANEEEQWQKGSKSNAKKEAEAAKKAEQARKKAEKDALAAEDDASTPGKSAPKKSKAPVKKSRGLDLSQLDGDKPSALSASGIDNALDALSLAHGSEDKVEKHPERRYPAAYKNYEERRLQEMKSDGSGVGLRLDQRKQRIRKEFEKHPDNPFNQVTVSYNATRDDVSQLKEQERNKIEQRLGN
ncbi:hypothetical protein G7046_g8141 [Stylonectria norvegica]|nr:hypothetical protein G7046_g8141 [Stylonectria norvegica]